MKDLIQIQAIEAVNLNCKTGVGEASARFCYAAAGLPDDVVAAFLDLLELYSDNYHTSGAQVILRC